MPVAFQSSTSIASNELLVDAIATFAAANGWTIEGNSLVGAVRTVTLRKPGVSDYVHIFTTSTNQVRMRASVSYDPAFPPGQQVAVTPTDCVINNLLGPYPNVWFFADGNEINVVVRRSDTTGAYSHMAFGVLTKYGVYSGGTFIDGSFFNTTTTSSGQWDSTNDHGMFGYGNANYGFVRVDADAPVNKWFPICNTNAADIAFSGVGPLGAANTYSANQLSPTYDLGRLINGADDNVFSGRSILHVIDLVFRRQGTPVYLSPAGYIANTRYVSLAKFDPERELSIADETWMVFPVVRKATESSTSGAPNASGNNGFAIRKVA